MVDGLSENQLARLHTIAIHLSGYACEKKIDEIINATLGVTIPTPESKIKATELVALVKMRNINHEEIATDLADIGRLIRIFCDLLVVCRMGDEIESYMSFRLSLLSESDLDWLLKIGKSKFG